MRQPWSSVRCKMEAVDLVISQQVNIAGDIPDTEKVPGHIQHGSPPGKARIVGDRSRAQIHGPGWTDELSMARGQQLPDGLNAIEKPGRLVCHQLDQLRCDGQFV